MSTLALASATVVTPAQAAPQQPPAPGTCWDYTYEQAIRSAYTGTPVACTEPHTVETVSTLEVPADIAKDGNASRTLVAWLEPQCQAAVNRYAGIAKPGTTAPGTRTWNFSYTPTQKEWKAGNHWVSCAAGSMPVSMNGTSTTVIVSDSIAGQPGLNKPRTFKDPTFGLGTYTARTSLTSWATRSYPGSSGLQPEAWKFCEKQIGSKKYFWYGPSEKEWYEGKTAIGCFALAKKK